MTFTVEDRHSMQLMGELGHVTVVDSLSRQEQERALERWNRLMNPDGLAFP